MGWKTFFKTTLLLLLCAATISSCKKDDEPITYAVTIANDSNGMANATIGGAAVTQAQAGETVTLIAMPKKGYTFTRWVVEGGNLSLSNEEANPVSFTMPAEAVRLKAEFGINNNEPTMAYAVTVTNNGNGTAKATIDGTAITQAQAGVTVTLTATPNEEYVFMRWVAENGNVILPNEKANPTNFTMPAGDVELKAEFENVDIITKIIDPIFREWCESAMKNDYSFFMHGELFFHPKWDTNGNGMLSPLEAEAVSGIAISSGATSLVGIEYFKNLEVLACHGNLLTLLDVSKNTKLKLLDCYGNQLTSLDVSKNTALELLHCSSNQLTSLDMSKNTALKVLSCDGNQLTSINVSENTALEILSCTSNELTSLNLLGNAALVGLTCDNNKLTSLNLSANTMLEQLHCRNNRMSTLDVSNMAWSSYGGFMIWCGNQTFDGYTPQTLTLTMREDQKTFWNLYLDNQSDNYNVVLAGE